MNKLRVLTLVSIAILVAACSSPPVRPKGLDLSGNWVLTTDSQSGTEDSDMSVAQTGKAIAGKLSTQMGLVDYTGSVEGNIVKFQFTIMAQGNNLKIDYAGTVAGDTMQGKAVFGAFGEGTFTAKRKMP